MASGHKKPRIIAGEAGGRRLAVPPGEGVRPTSDRVKESVFSALGAGPAGRRPRARPLRRQRGAGARGAVAGCGRGRAGGAGPGRRPGRPGQHRDVSGSATGPSSGSAPVAAFLGGPAARRPVRPGAARPAVRHAGRRGGGDLRRLAEGWLAPDATVVVERAAGSSPLQWPAGWGSTWERCYGDTLVLFAQRK